MYHHGYLLRTDADFDNAIYFESIISITRNGFHSGSGILRSHNETAVMLLQESYSKNDCEFKVCQLKRQNT